MFDGARAGEGLGSQTDARSQLPARITVAHVSSDNDCIRVRVRSARSKPQKGNDAHGMGSVTWFELRRKAVPGELHSQGRGEMREISDLSIVPGSVCLDKREVTLAESRRKRIFSQQQLIGAVGILDSRPAEALRRRGQGVRTTPLQPIRPQKLGVDSALADRVRYAVDGEHVRRDAVVHAVGLGVADDIVE